MFPLRNSLRTARFARQEPKFRLSSERELFDIGQLRRVQGPSSPVPPEVVMRSLHESSPRSPEYGPGEGHQRQLLLETDTDVQGVCQSNPRRPKGSGSQDKAQRSGRHTVTASGNQDSQPQRKISGDGGVEGPDIHELAGPTHRCQCTSSECDRSSGGKSRPSSPPGRPRIFR